MSNERKISLENYKIRSERLLEAAMKPENDKRFHAIMTAHKRLRRAYYDQFAQGF